MPNLEKYAIAGIVAASGMLFSACENPTVVNFDDCRINPDPQVGEYYLRDDAVGTDHILVVGSKTFKRGDKGELFMKERGVQREMNPNVPVPLPLQPSGRIGDIIFIPKEPYIKVQIETICVE